MKCLQHSVYIHSSAESIWKVLIDVENWHLWDSDVKSAILHGDFRVGTHGTLISTDNKSSTFFITAINKPNYYSNYYQFPFFTQLKFTHQIEPNPHNCQVIFYAQFTGPLAWYFAWRHNKVIQTVMKNAMQNLITLCHSP